MRLGTRCGTGCAGSGSVVLGGPDAFPQSCSSAAGGSRTTILPQPVRRRRGTHTRDSSSRRRSHRQYATPLDQAAVTAEACRLGHRLMMTVRAAWPITKNDAVTNQRCRSRRDGVVPRSRTMATANQPPAAFWRPRHQHRGSYRLWLESPLGPDGYILTTDGSGRCIGPPPEPPDRPADWESSVNWTVGPQLVLKLRSPALAAHTHLVATVR